MSKRAEQKAEEYEDSLDYYHYTSDNPSVAYQAGYEQAEKDTIERACVWWKTHLKGFINDGLISGILQEFSKAMEEE